MSGQDIDYSHLRLKTFNRRLILLLLFVLFLGYWLYVWQLEQVSQTIVAPQWWNNLVLAYPLLAYFTPFLLIPLQMLSLRVLRHLLPLLVGIYLARTAIQRFLLSFYELPDLNQARSLLNRLLNGHGASIGKILVTNRDNDGFRSGPLIEVSGPGSVSVSRGHALITELSGRFSRVLGPGNHTLERFEYPHSLLDVRPQEQKSAGILMVTGDGIDLRVDLSIFFQIDQGDQVPNEDQSFPFDADAARKAAYAQTVLDEFKVAYWDDLPLLVATRELSELIAESRLDELVHSGRAGIYPHPRLKTEALRRCRLVLRDVGIRVIDLRLGSFELPDPVVAQYINQWQFAQPEPSRVDPSQPLTAEEADLAWKSAQTVFLQTLIDGVEEARSRAPGPLNERDLARQMVASLETLIQQSQRLIDAPDQLLVRIQSIRQELGG